MISSETIGASSKPANAKQSFENARMSAASESRGRREPQEIGLAGPNRRTVRTAMTRRKMMGSQFAAPPRFWTHLPERHPTTLAATAIPMRTSDPTIPYMRLCSRWAYFVPKM